MEKFPFRPATESPATMATPSATSSSLPSAVVAIPVAPTETTSTDWRKSLPVLTGQQMVLRELQMEDAASLLALLTTEEVSRFISPPPTTVEGFEQFIAWTHRERARGTYVCFAVVPEGFTTAVGLFQVRSLEAGFATAEWGFAIGSSFWGSGLFVEGAKLVIDFTFGTVGAHRLEARAAVANGRGNGALRKIGAVKEAVLRRSFQRDGAFHDQLLWSILKEDWRYQRADSRAKVH